MFGRSDGRDDALMDSFHGSLESLVLDKIRRKDIESACCVTKQMPNSLWCATIAFMLFVLGLNSADAKEYEFSLVNVTTPANAGISNSTRPSAIACLPLGSCSSRRLLQEEALYRHVRRAYVSHKKHLRSISSYKLTGCIPRKDPLDHFHVYDGGFNVTDKHYWSSVTYTGIWGYVLAWVCLVFSVIYGFLYCCGCCHQSSEEGVSRVRLICIYAFSFIAIIAAAIIYWGNAKLGQQLRATAGTLLTATDGIQSEINNALGMVQVASMFPISRQGSSQQFLQACVNLGNTFNNLQRKVKKNKDRVYRIFDNVKEGLTVVSVILAIFVAFGLVGTIGSWRYVLLITFCLMTILLYASWIMAGVSYALTNVANDACQIMNEYDENPQNSSISKYLPCLSNSEASKALAGAKEAIKSLVTQANVAIDWVNREEKRISSKKSLPAEFLLPRVCDPYGPPPTYNDSLCLSGETSFGDFEKVYGQYRCDNDNLPHCFEQDTPIPNFAYEEADMAMNASNIVYRMLPSIYRIITCNFVKVTFEDILYHNCRPLRKSLTTLWAGFVVASLAMIPLQILWVLLTRTLGRDQGFRTRSPNNLVRRIDLPHSAGWGIFGRMIYRLRRALGQVRSARMFYPAMPGFSQPGSRAGTPISGTVATNSRAAAGRRYKPFRSIYMFRTNLSVDEGILPTDVSPLQPSGGSLGWLRNAVSLSPTQHPARLGLSLAGARRAHTPATVVPTDFSRCGGSARSSLGWLRGAVSRSPTPHPPPPGLSLAGSRVPTPGTVVPVDFSNCGRSPGGSMSWLMNAVSRSPTVHPPPPGLSSAVSRVPTPGTVVPVDFSNCGGSPGGSLSWLMNAVSRSPTLHPGRLALSLPGSRATTPRTGVPSSRPGTPAGAPGPRIGTPDVAMPRSGIPTTSTAGSTRNQGFGHT